jgi:Domain of unknown function (DUF4136)
MSHSHRVFVMAGALAASVLVITVGAQKVDIKTNQADKTDFKAFKTYAWLPPVPVVKNVAPDAASNPTLSEEALGPAIVAAIDRELAARGIAKAPFDTADLHVAYLAAMSIGFSQSYLGEYYGYITGWASPIPIGIAPTTGVTVYEKGAVVVDIVDRAANKAVWRGTAMTRIAQEHTVEKRIERINEAAKKMFDKYPVKPAK